MDSNVMEKTIIYFSQPSNQLDTMEKLPLLLLYKNSPLHAVSEGYQHSANYGSQILCLLPQSYEH